MKNVIAGLVLASLVAMASPAEARRWFRRSYTTSTCPNGQCYAPAPVATDAKQAQKAVPPSQAAQTTAVAAPMKPTVQAEPTAEEPAVAEAPAAAPSYYYANNTRRNRLRWFRR